MSPLQLFLLGPLDIRCGGEQLPRPPTLKSQSLLAYLALHRQSPLPRERLAGLFWADRPERRARRSLTTALWHVRQCLPKDDGLLSDSHTVQLNPRMELWLDAAEFESLVSRGDLPSLESAVALYQGDLMDGFYDDWVVGERYRIQALYSEALARLMAGLEARGAYSQALGTGMRLLHHDPLREDAYQLTMRAYCRLGQRNAALEQYRRCHEVVEQELNAEPMVETKELYQAILDGHFEVGSVIEAVAPATAHVELPPRPGQDPFDPIARSPLVGRDAEMAFLQDCFEGVRSGNGCLVLVDGEAGVGKTRLMEEFADRLRWQGVRVLWGRCYEFERVLPYQPLSEALQTVLSSMAATELESLAPRMLVELSRLVPELLERLPRLDAHASLPPDQEQPRLFEGVAQFLAGLSASSTLAVVLDDLHWATESTLEMVHYLVRHLSDQRLLIVGTLRPEAAGPDSLLGAFQRHLGREERLHSLPLAPLTPQAVEAMVVGMSGSGDAVVPLARRLFTETEGNPFFLVESVKGLFEAGMLSLEGGSWGGDFLRVSAADLPLPTGVREVILDRVRRLDRDSRQALRVAAVLGREFDSDLLAATWNKGEDATLEALDVLLRRGLIGEGSGILGRDYTFHHHMIRETVYARIPLRQRQHLHARAGKAMESLYSSNLAAMAGELAFHFDQGRHADNSLAPEAVAYLLSSGDQARLAYAHREAIDYYLRALALQKELGEHEQAGRTLMKLGVVYHSKFDFAQAHQAFEESFAQWQQASSQEQRAPQSPAPHALRIRWRSPYSLDPAMVRDYVSAMIVDQLFRGLVSTTPELDIVPEVAEYWKILEGGRSYRFHLRTDARWSDGMPVTAHDFEYSWKRMLSPATQAVPSVLLPIRGSRAFHQGEFVDADRIGVRALDERTLSVELEEPVSHFLYLLADVTAYPVPRHVIAAHGAAWAKADQIVSNGPFMLKEWKRGERMRLVRNPLYTGPWRGNVEEVELYFPQDLSVPLEQYGRGGLDVLTLTDASVHEGDRIRREFPAEYISAPWPFTVYLGFITNRAPFDDVRVRQALALASDRQALANVVLRGMYTPGTGGFVPPGLPGAAAGIGLPYHPDRARQLLAGVGHPKGTGLPVLDGLTVPPIDPLITQYLQRQWREALGIDVVWKVADWPAFSRRLQHDPPHLFILARFASLPDPGDFLDPEQLREDTGWASPDHGALAEQAGRVVDQQARLGLLRQADQILMHEAPIVPLFYGRQHLLVKPWVRRFPISALNRWYWQDTVLEPH